MLLRTAGEGTHVVRVPVADVETACNGTRPRAVRIAIRCLGMSMEVDQNRQSISPKSILLVDDEPMVTSALRLLLLMRGHRVEDANCGEAALSLYGAGKYDLVIVDFNMPGLDGLEVAEAIRKQSPTQKIVLITGMMKAVELDPRGLSHVNTVLEKPFSREQVEAMMHSIFPSD